MPTIDVAIVISNRPEYSMACLESLYAVQHGVKIRPIVVDNGSRNRTRTLIEAWAADLATLSPERQAEIETPLIVTMPNNLGFAAGLNAAIASADPARPFMVLHNDALPFTGAIGEMAWALENGDEDAVVVIPRTGYANEGTPCVPEIRKRVEAVKPPTKERLTTDEVRELMSRVYPDGMDEIVGPSGLLQRTLPRTSYSPEVSSFCMLVRPGSFEKYGTFDPEFAPRGYEDKYWFQVVERAGGICLLSNWAYAHHWGNMSSDGPGYCFNDVMKASLEMFNKKCAQRDKDFFSKQSV